MMLTASPSLSFFFFNDTATTEIYTLPLHDALPIYAQQMGYARSKLAAERLCQHAERAGLDARIEARPLRMLAEPLGGELRARIAHLLGIDRKSVVEGKSVDLGGRRIIKKKKGERRRGGQHHQSKTRQLYIQ